MKHCATFVALLWRLTPEQSDRAILASILPLANDCRAAWAERVRHSVLAAARAGILPGIAGLNHGARIVGGGGRAGSTTRIYGLANRLGVVPSASCSVGSSVSATS